jgi:hypothetical protein
MSSKSHKTSSGTIASLPGGPLDVFQEWLAGRPQDTRVGIVIDSDRLLVETGVLGKPTTVDPGGREWQVVVFRGDDLAFRLAFRKASGQMRSIIVLTRGPGGDGKIDVSYLTDILARNEAGLPLDLSVPAFFRRICPKINFPVTELRRYKDALLVQLPNVPKATAKIVERWGRPDDWGRGQVAAMVLLAHHPELTLGEMWTDETEPSDFLAHAIRILLGAPQLSEDRVVVLEVIREAAKQQVRPHLFWLDLPGDELAAYLVLRAFAQQAGLQNPSTQLAGLYIFSREMPVPRMETVALSVIERLQAEPNTWAAIERIAEGFLTPRRLTKVTDLLPSLGAPQGAPAILGGAGIPPSILLHQVRTALLAFFEKPSVDALEWAAKLASHPFLVKPSGELSARAVQARAALRFASGVLWAEQRLAEALPKFVHADALLEWYAERGSSVLELKVAGAYHDLEACEDEELAAAGRRYLFGGSNDLSPSPESLKGRMRGRLDELDRILAGFIRPNPEQFARGARSILGYLQKTVKDAVGHAIAGDDGGRVWVLIFDGMRFDTWSEVVQPLLAEHFNIKSMPHYCVPPSSTHIARTSLLAGCLPTEWRGYKGTGTKDESTLVARNLGLTAQEVKSKLRFVTEADTTKARMTVGFAGEDGKEVNVLIYPISDECHAFRGDLAAFNRKIRTEILGEKAQGGARGILDDLLRCIRPEDTAVIVSDHGFTELLAGDSVLVKQAETPQENVLYRYVRDYRPADAPESVEVAHGSEKYFLAVGRQWFRREGSTVPDRYSHGGVSLVEMVVPGAIIKRVTEKAARAELEGLPMTGAVAVPEDQDLEVSFAIRNSGNVEVEFDVTARTNLSEDLLAYRGKLAAGAIFKTAVQLHGRYRETQAREIDPTGTTTALTIRLRHTDLKGNWRDALDGMVTIPVSVQKKAFKIETEAFKGFDDV